MTLIACEKDDNYRLIAPEYRNQELQSGGEYYYPIHTDDWAVSAVKDGKTGEVLLDLNQKPLTVKDREKRKAANGWIELDARSAEGVLIVKLAENFNDEPRQFVLEFQSAGKKDYMHLEQHRGSRYQVVQLDTHTIQSKTRTYWSSDECTTTLFVNDTKHSKHENLDVIFKNVTATSEFRSDDKDAFAWLDLVDEVRFALTPKWVLYKEGLHTELYLSRNSLNDGMFYDAGQAIELSGEVEYEEREGTYTIHLKNHDRDLITKYSGTWKVKQPIRFSTKKEREYKVD